LAATPTGAAAIELRLARCRLLVGCGDLRTAEDELDVLTTLCDQTVGPRFQAPLLTLRAGLAMFQDRPDVARAHIARGLQVAGRDHEDIWVLAPLVWHGIRAEAEAADLAVVRGEGPDPAQVELLREHMRELVERSQTAAPGLRATVLGYLRLFEAEASRVAGESDPDLWATAAAAWAANAQPYPAAYCRYHQAEALFRRRARAAGAVDALAEAHRTAHRLGAWPLHQLVETLATHGRVVLPPHDTDSAASPARGAAQPSPRASGSATTSPYDVLLARLTERERLVLAVLAEGRTNREIARTLFISEKTVSVHVSHILAKLEVNTRVEAAMLVHRFGGLSGS
ncbi:MAG TPA: response regulator transcription factor, partial [Mycobacteriales bacterium]|nr:response regulator transcription factor [Mycobacteriales bacterium]